MIWRCSGSQFNRQNSEAPNVGFEIVTGNLKITRKLLTSKYSIK